MTRTLATVAALVGLAGAAPGAAAAAVPVPWCGTSASAVDRLPDATLGFAVHVLYVRAPGSPDRFAEWAPRLAGDAADIEAWWRAQDATRSPRFDLFAAPGCASSFGALDITSLELAIDGPETGFLELRSQLVARGLDEAEKAYLLYYDGATGQSGRSRICGIGATRSSRGPALAVVFLEPCDGETDDFVRQQTAAHELLHALGAVSSRAPNTCAPEDQRGHVCDAPLDLMTPTVSGEPLAAHALDANRDDYYGHAGTWLDLQDSLFLERLDGNDRTPPTTPGGLRVGDTASALTRISWQPSQDDAGPISYRVYEDGVLVDVTPSTSTIVPGAAELGRYAVRAADAAGHLSAPATARFRQGVGMVDESGRLVRDTVRPPLVGRVTVRRTKATSTLTWPAVRDAGGIASYRVRIGTRTVVVRRPGIALARARVTGNVSIAAVDRAGNVGPALVVPRSRVR